MHDVKSFIKSVVSLKPQITSGTSAHNGAAVDTQGFDSAMIILETGAKSGTTPTLDVKIQECATSDGSFADISGAAFTQIGDTADQSKTMSLDLKGKVGSRKRYIRVIATPGGTTPTYYISSVVMLGRISKLPITNPAQ